jgi:hypothetical protein
MKGKILITGLMVLLSLSLFSCGGGNGGPGTSGGEDTGIKIKSVSINREAGPDLDAAIHACSDTEVEVGLFRDDAVMTIDAAILNDSGLSEPFPASVEQCTITYLKANEDPSSPIIPSLTIYPNCIIVEAANNSCNVALIDIQRKRDFWTAVTNGVNIPSEVPTHYIALYRCKYTGNFGESGYFEVEYDIWLADFDVC